MESAPPYVLGIILAGVFATAVVGVFVWLRRKHLPPSFTTKYGTKVWTSDLPRIDQAGVEVMQDTILDLFPKRRLVWTREALLSVFNGFELYFVHSPIVYDGVPCAGIVGDNGNFCQVGWAPRIYQTAMVHEMTHCFLVCIDKLSYDIISSHKSEVWSVIAPIIDEVNATASHKIPEPEVPDHL